MKAYLELKKQIVPNYEANGLWKTIRLSAKEHGYKSAIVFGIIRLKDHCLNTWAQTLPWNKARVMMQRWRGVTIGKNVHIGTYVNMDLPYPYFVVVEDGVSLAGSIDVVAHNKPLGYHKNVSDSYVAPVIIRKNAWVAVGATILPGVEIGEGAIVAAGSIVNKDVPPMVMVAGTPAKMIKDFSEKLRNNYSEEEFDMIMKNRKEKFGI